MTQVTRSTCPYCGTGCGVLIHHDGQRIVDVEGDPQHPANFGRLCSKGSTLHLSTAQTTRALYPTRFPRHNITHEKIPPSRRLSGQRVGWDEALDEAAEHFGRIIEQHGPDAVAFYVSGQLLTEDYYVFNKLARALAGTHNIDSNSRLCMSSAVSAYKRTLGADAPPCNYEDFDHADLVLIAGANPAWAHPILFGRLREAKTRQPEQKLIVIDPRRTETAAVADLHLQIEPGTDTVLLGAMLHVMVWENLTDPAFIAAHTDGFAVARDAVRDLTPDKAARLCGVPAEQIVTAARWFAGAKAALSLWCQGLNQSHHGSDNGAALIHLHLATGQIGRAGAGPFSLTGQPNAMGGRETGTMANLLPGHRDPANPADCAEVAAAWGIPALPATPGKSATEIFAGLADGSIKAVWIACTNPAHSLPDQTTVRAALTRAEYVVVQEAFADTETCAFADLVLPAATWGEKEGTVTNSERRITRVQAAVAAPGDTRPDWRIARDFALALGRRLGRADAPRLFGWTTSGEIFAEHAALTAGRDLDIAALSHAVLERDGPQQWPYFAGQGTARLYTDHHFATADGKARFVAVSLAGTHEPTSASYPLHLTSTRLRDQWHGMSRTGLVPRLHDAAPTATLALAPGELARRQWRDGQLVRIASARGEIVLPVASDPALKSGHAVIPMHFGRRRLSNSGANELIAGALDPYSRQPELKHAAVRVEDAALPWRGLLLLACGDGDAALADSWAWSDALSSFAYAALSVAGRAAPVLELTLAHDTTPDAALLAALTALPALADAETLVYEDEKRGIGKTAWLRDGKLAAVAYFGETAAGPWLRDAMLADAPVAEFRRQLFAPSAQAPVARPTRGRIVCACRDISENDIRAAIAEGCDTPAAIREKLGAGGGCGSCQVEIGRLCAAAAVTA